MIFSEKWMQHFMAHAALNASCSKDPERQVGAVIVDSQRRVLSSGYNGFPRGVRDDHRLSGPLKLSMVVHAEANAILNATGSVREAIMFVTRFPCTGCAKLIIQAGVMCLVSPGLPAVDSKWRQDAEIAREMFGESGVEQHYTDEWFCQRHDVGNDIDGGHINLVRIKR